MGVPFQWGYALTRSLCNGNTSKFSTPSPRLQYPGNNTWASVFLYINTTGIYSSTANAPTIHVVLCTLVVYLCFVISIDLGPFI
jgi:hypothetical protein